MKNQRAFIELYGVFSIKPIFNRKILVNRQKHCSLLNPSILLNPLISPLSPGQKSMLGLLEKSPLEETEAFYGMSKLIFVQKLTHFEVNDFGRISIYRKID